MASAPAGWRTQVKNQMKAQGWEPRLVAYDGLRWYAVLLDGSELVCNRVKWSGAHSFRLIPVGRVQISDPRCVELAWACLLKQARILRQYRGSS